MNTLLTDIVVDTTKKNMHDTSGTNITTRDALIRIWWIFLLPTLAGVGCSSTASPFAWAETTQPTTIDEFLKGAYSSAGQTIPDVIGHTPSGWTGGFFENLHQYIEKNSKIFDTKWTITFSSNLNTNQKSNWNAISLPIRVTIRTNLEQKWYSTADQTIRIDILNQSTASNPDDHTCTRLFWTHEIKRIWSTVLHSFNWWPWETLGVAEFDKLMKALLFQ